MATAIRIVYALAIGVFVVLTVGFGTVTFFPDPEQPEFPAELRALRPRPAGEERAVEPARPPAGGDERPAASAARLAYDDAYQ